jgi:hypothetical protein
VGESVDIAAPGKADGYPEIREPLMFCTKILVQNIRTSLISGDFDG